MVDCECSLVTWIFISLPPWEDVTQDCNVRTLVEIPGSVGEVPAGVATWGVLAVVFVQLDQHGGGHHQEVSEGHGDGVGHHGEALAQATQALEKKGDKEFYEEIKSVSQG